MKIIISPAKKMVVDTDSLSFRDMPQFIDKTEELKKILDTMSFTELKELWKCSDKLAEINTERLREMNLYKNLTPAIFSYEGIQYQYMAPDVFTADALEYIQSHLYILSGFYGIVRPFDGVTPYRLEMQSRLSGENFKSLYEFWGKTITDTISAETDTIINLASNEYSKVISNNISPDIKFITCFFGELVNGKVKEKGTACKMARGEMVRYMAENNITDVEKIKDFQNLGYCFSQELSDENNFVFVLNRKVI